MKQAEALSKWLPYLLSKKLQAETEYYLYDSDFDGDLDLSVPVRLTDAEKAYAVFLWDDADAHFKPEPVLLRNPQYFEDVKRICTLQQGFVFNDLLSNFERVADHCSNIAVALVELHADSFDTHEYLSNIKNRQNAEFQQMYEEYSREFAFFS